MKKLLVFIVVLCTLMSLAAGCGQSNSSQSTTQAPDQTEISTSAPAESVAAPDNPYPIVKEKVTLKVFRVLSPLNGNWNDLDMMKDMEAKTNVHWEEIPVTNEAFLEKKNLAIATGDLPDVFYMSTTAADEDKDGPDGTLIPLDELIAANGPHITKQFIAHPGLKKATTSLDGKIYSLGTACSTATMGSYYMYINTKMLNDAGLKKPKTVDELYEALKVLKAKDPSNTPFVDRDLNGVVTPVIMGWFGVASPETTYVNIVDGKVNFAYASAGYKAYLEFMAKLYKEKILNQDFFTITPEQLVAKIKEGKVALTQQAYQGDYKQYEQTEGLTSSLNSKPQMIPVEKYYTGSVAITKVCKTPDVVIKWFDIFYRDENEITENGAYGPSLCYGRKGIDWDYLDPEKKTWDYVFDWDKTAFNSYYLAAIKTRVLGWTPGMIINMANSPDPYMAWVGDNNLKFYYPNMDESCYFPSTVRFSDTESQRLSVLGTDLKTAIDEYKAKVITGQDTTASWDAYVAKLKSIGMDEFVQIKQTAWERYNK